MAIMTFYPLGNADCCQIKTKHNKRILFDYAHVREAENDEDKRCDLAALLRKEMKDAGKDAFDIVAFTHLDRDHCGGARDFFYFGHAAKYQTGDRIKIEMLWVPAAAILEDDPCEDARIIRQEARYRLKEGKGIRVFSRPEKLKDWLESEGLSLDDRKHLITDAGNLIPSLTLADDGIEFFLHSPFAKRLDDGSLEDRNIHSIVVQVVFQEGEQKTKLILGSDVPYECLQDIVNISKYHGNEERLEWDVFELPHHCSYKTLAEEKGTDKTEPVEEVKWLFEEQGQKGGIIISTSDPIPSEDTRQLPHRQAANYYKDVVNDLGGEFIATMEYTKISNPEPLVVEVSESKACIRKQLKAASFSILSQSSPRAG
jgi:hypothetical protein